VDAAAWHLVSREECPEVLAASLLVDRYRERDPHLYLCHSVVGYRVAGV